MPASVGYQATRAEDGAMVIHHVPIFCACERGKHEFDEDWIKAAVKRAKQHAEEGYFPPLHVRHHEPATEANDSVRAAGFFQITGHSRLMLKGQERLAIFADLVVTDPAAQHEIRTKQLPYRSVEIFNVDEPNIDGLALLDHEAPFLQLPMLFVDKVQGDQRTDIPMELTSFAEDRDGAVMCFRRGQHMSLLMHSTTGVNFADDPITRARKLATAYGIPLDAAKKIVTDTGKLVEQGILSGDVDRSGDNATSRTAERVSPAVAAATAGKKPPEKNQLQKDLDDVVAGRKPDPRAGGFVPQSSMPDPEKLEESKSAPPPQAAPASRGRKPKKGAAQSSMNLEDALRDVNGSGEWSPVEISPPEFGSALSEESTIAMEQAPTGDGWMLVDDDTDNVIAESADPGGLVAILEEVGVEMDDVALSQRDRNLLVREGLIAPVSEALVGSDEESDDDGDDKSGGADKEGPGKSRNDDGKFAPGGTGTKKENQRGGTDMVTRTELKKKAAEREQATKQGELFNALGDDVDPKKRLNMEDPDPDPEEGLPEDSTEETPEGFDIGAVLEAIENGSISVAHMDAILAAIQTQRSTVAPADPMGQPAVAAAPGAEAMKQDQALVEQFAALKGENEALRADIDTMKAAAARTEEVSVALKRLEGVPLGSDPKGRLTAFHEEHGSDAFKAFVDSFVQHAGVIEPKDGDDPDAAKFSAMQAKASNAAMKYQAAGVEAVEKAINFSAQWKDLHERGHTTLSEERYLELNVGSVPQES